MPYSGPVRLTITNAIDADDSAGLIRYDALVSIPGQDSFPVDGIVSSSVGAPGQGRFAAAVGTEWPGFIDDEIVSAYIAEGGTGAAVGSSRTFARIAAATPLGSNTWQYAAVRQVKATAGYGGWADTGAPFELRNTMEENNTGSGIEGNGVNVGTLPDGFSLRPLAIDAVVPYWTVKVDFTGETEYWCSVVNAVDGECQ
jgi:hypothetical protein